MGIAVGADINHELLRLAGDDVRWNESITHPRLEALELFFDA